MAPIRVAVLGFGMSATTFHIPFIKALSDDFEFKVIFERRATATSSKARDAFPGVKVVNTLEAAVTDPEVDLVFVTTINDTHYEYVKASLEAGKHVVVEKPVTPTSQEAYELAELAKQKGRVLAVYQNRRWDGDFLTVKKLIGEGSLGVVSEFRSHFDRFKNEPATAKVWKEEARPGSGAAFDLGSHLIDQAVSLFGKPKAVTGLVRNSRKIGHEQVHDSYIIHLHYDESSEPYRTLPLLVTVSSSILCLTSPPPRFTILGTKGSFVKAGVDPQEDQLKSQGSSAISDARYGHENPEQAGTLFGPPGSQPQKVTTLPGDYKQWFSNVARSVKANDPSMLIVTPEQAAYTIHVIEQAIESSKQGKTMPL